MLDQIIQFAKDQMGGEVKNTHGLSDDQHNEVFNIAQSSLFDSIKGQIAVGNVSQILDVFNGNASAQDNPVAGSVQNNVVQGLMDKFGFDNAKAGGIASAIIPAIMNRFSSPETGNAADAGDLVKKIGLDSDSGIAGIVSQLSGEGGIGNMVKGLFGDK
jgi:hypothetical protein